MAAPSNNLIDSNMPATKAAAALPDAPIEEIQALLAVVTVTDGDAFDTLDRMGLQLVTASD